MSKFLLFILLILPFNLYGNAYEKLGFADLVEPLLPAVVNISIIHKAPKNAVSRHGFSQLPPGFEEFNELFERFGMIPGIEDDEKYEQQEKPTGAGSGFIIDSKGYIVTNCHVVDGAEKILVKLSNEMQLEAKLVGSDVRSDLALLKIEHNKDLPFIKFGLSDESRVGDVIIAIGNPFGLGGTVTSGIISAMARDINAGSIVDNFIQTDAPINGGNSGGPMINMKGEVIGINAIIISPSGGNVGIGFAIPSSFAKPIIEQMKSGGKIQRAWLGVSIQTTDDVYESLGLKEAIGALVAGVDPSSPAGKAGIIVGDVIMKLDGKDIKNSRQLSRIVAESTINKAIEVELLSNGKKKTVKLILGELDPSKEKKIFSQNGGIDKANSVDILGISLDKISNDLRNKYNIPSNLNGALVVSVEKNSFAYKKGIRQGDILVAVNQQPISSPEEASKIITQSKKMGKQYIFIGIYRQGINMFLQLPLK